MLCNTSKLDKRGNNRPEEIRGCFRVSIFSSVLLHKGIKLLWAHTLCAGGRACVRVCVRPCVHACVVVVVLLCFLLFCLLFVLGLLLFVCGCGCWGANLVHDFSGPTLSCFVCSCLLGGHDVPYRVGIRKRKFLFFPSIFQSVTASSPFLMLSSSLKPDTFCGK